MQECTSTLKNTCRSNSTNSQGWKGLSFPYDVSNPTGPERNCDDHLKEAIEAVEKGTTVIHSILLYYYVT